MKNLHSIPPRPGAAKRGEKGWTSLFNGKDFTGWKVNENTTPSQSKRRDRRKRRAQPLLLRGNFQNHTFKDFELKVDVMTLPGSNGGIYVDTDFRKAAGQARASKCKLITRTPGTPQNREPLFSKDNGSEVAKDNQWFTEHLIVKGRHVTILVDDKQVLMDAAGGLGRHEGVPGPPHWSGHHRVTGPR